MNEKYSGILIKRDEKFVLLSNYGAYLFSDRIIWEGYGQYFLNHNIEVSELEDTDYEKCEKILLMYPLPVKQESDFIELYYNERLVKYPASRFGHLSLNCNGTVFNFSHLINECEIISEEEYFFRPALGHFSPNPQTNLADYTNPEKLYYDKFGRLFMRNVHVLRLSNVDSSKLANVLTKRMKLFKEAGLGAPSDKNSAFRPLSHNCVTEIADALKECGFGAGSHFIPRDCFAVTGSHWRRLAEKSGYDFSYYIMKQMPVKEAKPSKLAFLINPFNYLRWIILSKKREDNNRWDM